MTQQSIEQTPLLNGNTNIASSEQQVHLLPRKRPWWRKVINPRLTRRPWRVFEICDFGFVPGFIRRRCQTILSAAWIYKIPLLQTASPAELAATLIMRTLEEMGDLESSKISIVDFCSGAGGPVPTIEKLVNERRQSLGKKPIPFLLSDLYPSIDSWMAITTKSHNLSFVPQPVDATDPPIAVTSATASNNRTQEGYFSDSRIFRLYCLSFHHFEDELAKKVLRSTLSTADGFAIIELQDRYLSSFVLMLGHIPLMFGLSIFRFWRDVLMLILVYIIPIVPVINTWDGLVSSLRTRSFEEVMRLLDGETKIDIAATTTDEGIQVKTAREGDWLFKAAYQMHSWPVGYMNWIVGYKKAE